MLRAIDCTHHTRIRLIFHVDDAVGVIAAAEINHVYDVEIVIGQYRQDVTEYLGDVFIAECNPVATIPGHLGVGIIDRIPDISIFQKIHQLFSSHDGTILLGLAGTGADVR